MELNEDIIKKAAAETAMMIREKSQEMIEAHAKATGNFPVGIRIVFKQGDDKKLNTNIKLGFTHIKVTSEKSFTFGDEPLFDGNGEKEGESDE